MIAVIIPAHNEAECMAACLASVFCAASHPELHEAVEVIVAVDRCTDATAELALALGAHVIDVPAPGGVGSARAAAASKAIALGADWLAVTDADSRVPADWLVEQRRADADVFCGVVQVEDWLDYSDEVRCRFEQTQATGQGHGRIHGANLGVSTTLYQQCGGFSALTCSEDVALVHARQAIDAAIAWSPRSVVWTSARRQARAVGGFSDFLKQLEAATCVPA
ncbi:glycosyltransferase [Xanthomonas phaseoli pv. phaseoli]|uniref:Glycosyl transferase n=1 Tax=Xanthomonas campestris pv. phaseoli TaxID=317013 RepID=A0AB34QDJ2_XANCH|nr:glycosyltransferase [Xanthomonas phaseoli]KHS33444.1 glycosyl transferase [Xanthomonas phaseoli pv. phaseoli]MDM4802474.1 glycosyltransferase [Xanthomonas phaseoli pv. phaseoli]MDM4806549.1 glycosyltransferase [Xanthomonas phaseoli pv. phaseoli]MDM4810620.1 glycosyltransferase [Xanthomonas phaseoli pv. phaseoli]QWN24846.1 glycosyl transferase [Xanthomonas phaseoli pv. phaseoli]